MDETPTRSTRMRKSAIGIAEDESENVARAGRIRKPPPITPRRFNKFFTPRPRNTSQTVQTSRRALRTISGSVLNRRTADPAFMNGLPQLPATDFPVNPRKRKIQFVSENHAPIEPPIHFPPSSQELPQSSPIKYGRHSPELEVLTDEEMEDDLATEVNDELYPSDVEFVPEGPRITRYAVRSKDNYLLSRRINGRSKSYIQAPSSDWQHETGDFYSSPHDINTAFHNRQGQQDVLPFSMAACHTNPVIAVGDEEGVVRLLNSSNDDRNEEHGFKKTITELIPHDNAVMDLTFSPDDSLIATASGDQTCQIIDVQQRQSLFSLRAHSASVKKLQFQPGNGNNVLSSCGRDGLICLWDLRVKGRSLGTSRRDRIHVTEMAESATLLSPVLTILDAHSKTSWSKVPTKQNKVHSIHSRNDFSITSLSFLGSSRNNLLATASEVDTVIKIWDMRSTSSRAARNASQIPVSVTDQPISHEKHRRFGINSIALSTDNSRIYALSRDHTVYAYSASHLILGCNAEYTSGTKSRLAPLRTEASSGLGPLYGLRHPSLRVATFWPRLSIRPATSTQSELLAVASSDDCVVLFPTGERHLTSSTRRVPALHDPSSQSNPSMSQPSTTTPMAPGQNSTAPLLRPNLRRSATSSFTTLFTQSRISGLDSSDELPIYYHGTPLINGHDKETTSVSWSSEGNLISASDDYTVRCWRDNRDEARRLRTTKDKVERLDRGWADVGVRNWDAEDDEC